MKTTVTLAIFLLAVFMKTAGQDVTSTPYDIKSGIIEYSFYGDKVGKGTYWFDDFGMKSAMYTEYIVKGQTVKRWEITNGNYQYSYNPAKPKEGIKIKNPVLAWSKGTLSDESGLYMESVYIRMGMKKSGTETFLGRGCIVYKGNAGKLLTWHGIPILLDLKKDGQSTRQAATSVKTNVVVSAKNFNVPVNITFTEKAAQ
jgi:hypothetical protein